MRDAVLNEIPQMFLSSLLISKILLYRKVTCGGGGVQFADGVYLVLLMGLLEGYFVPLYNFFLTPENFEQKV